MGTFGWSYPPGCSGTPFDEPTYCEVCGCDTDDCVCPECPECGAVGDPRCYTEHGLVMSPEQLASKEEADRRAAEAAASEEADYYSDCEGLDEEEDEDDE